MQEKKYEVSRGGAITILVVLSLLWLINFSDRSIMTVALEAVKADFKLTDTQAGTIVALVTAGIAIMMIPASIFGDRWARRKIISIMALIWSAATLVTGFCANVGQMFVARFMVGAGEAGYSPVGQTWLSVSFPKRVRSLIIGIFFACGQMGMVLGLILGGWLITTTGDWRTPFYLFGIPGILLAVIVFFLPDYKTVKAEGEALLSKQYFRNWSAIFKCPSFWMPTIGGIFFIGTVTAVANWTPALLMRAYNLDAAASGQKFGIVSLILILAPLGGVIADAWQRRNKSGRPWHMAVTSLLALIFYTAAFFSLGKPIEIFLVLLALGLLFTALNLPVGLTVINDVVTPGLRSTAIGISGLIGQLLGATMGIVAVGAVSDRLGGGSNGLQWGLIYMLPLFALSVIANLILVKYYANDSTKCTDEVFAEK
jgi:MFS family permease